MQNREKRKRREMNFQTKYGMGDSVCFFNKGALADPEVLFGEICRVAVSQEGKESPCIYYSVHVKTGIRILTEDNPLVEHEVILSVAEPEVYLRPMFANDCIYDARTTVKALYSAELQEVEKQRVHFVSAVDRAKEDLNRLDNRIAVLHNKVDTLNRLIKRDEVK